MQFDCLDQSDRRILGNRDKNGEKSSGKGTVSIQFDSLDQSDGRILGTGIKMVRSLVGKGNSWSRVTRKLKRRGTFFRAEEYGSRSRTNSVGTVEDWNSKILE